MEIDIWVAVDRNGWIGLYSTEPTKNEQTGKWDSPNPFCNYQVRKELEALIKRTDMGWNSEPAFFKITL